MMLFALAIAALLACAQGHERIVGGQPADITEVPYTAALLMDYCSVGAYNQVCVGTIISNGAILTAARCADFNLNVDVTRVRVGSSLHNTGGQIRFISLFIPNRFFNPRFENDIAVIILTVPLSFGPSIQPAVLPNQDDSVPDGAVGLISGWGALSGSDSTQLQKASVSVINQQTCIDTFIDYNPVTEGMICAGADGVNTCSGDMGGPMIIDGVLHGIVSWTWGNGCGVFARTGVYTRVAYYRDWIRDYVNI